MKKNELVWRELIDAAIMRKQRRWDNVEDLAFRAGVAPATATYALRRLIDIGAIKQHHAGFTVVNPEKVLTLACAARNITGNKAFAILTLDTRDLQRFLSPPLNQGLILGGADAAIDLLGGENTVSDFSEHIFYLRNSEAEQAVDAALQRMKATRHTGRNNGRGNVTFLRADSRAARTWQTFTPFAQTYTDLFVTPGWQASEFRLALRDKFFGAPDWDQE